MKKTLLSNSQSTQDGIGELNSLQVTKKMKRARKRPNIQSFTQTGLNIGTSFLLTTPYISPKFGDEIFDKKSSSTLQHTIHSYSVPRSMRFNKDQSDTIFTELRMKSTLSNREVGVPKSRREGILSRNYLKEAKPKPSPHAYTIPDYFSQGLEKRRGKTMGLPFSMLSKAVPPGTKNNGNLDEAKDMPGPGQYEMEQYFGKKGIFKSIYRKGKMVNEMNKKEYPDVIYSPKFNLVQRDRYTDIGIGYGHKQDIVIHKSITPGPKYHLPGIFDKYQKNQK